MNKTIIELDKKTITTIENELTDVFEDVIEAFKEVKEALAKAKKSKDKAAINIFEFCIDKLDYMITGVVFGHISYLTLIGKFQQFASYYIHGYFRKGNMETQFAEIKNMLISIKQHTTDENKKTREKIRLTEIELKKHSSGIVSKTSQEIADLYNVNLRTAQRWLNDAKTGKTTPLPPDGIGTEDDWQTYVKTYKMRHPKTDKTEPRLGITDQPKKGHHDY